MRQKIPSLLLVLALLCSLTAAWAAPPLSLIHIWRYFRSHRRENPLPAAEQV